MSDTGECSDRCWHEMIVAMNANGEDVTVPAASLDELLECHRRLGASVAPADLVRKHGRSKVVVNRMRLWALVQEHGKLCGDKRV